MRDSEIIKAIAAPNDSIVDITILKQNEARFSLCDELDAIFSEISLKNRVDAFGYFQSVFQQFTELSKVSLLSFLYCLSAFATTLW